MKMKGFHWKYNLVMLVTCFALWSFNSTKKSSLTAAPTLNIGSDTLLTCGDTILLDASANYVSYLWSDGSVNQTLMVTDTGKYWVQVTDSMGAVCEDTIHIGLSLENGLIGYYPFDNNFQDYSPSQNHGTPTGVTIQNGLVGNGAKFDSTSHRLPLNQNFNLNNNFTIAAWVKPDTIHTTVFVMRDQCASTYRGYSKASFSVINNQLYYMVNVTANAGGSGCNGGSAGDRYRAVGAYIPPNCFTHVAVKITNNSSESRTVQLFVNGTEYSDTQTLNVPTSPSFSASRNYTSYIGSSASYLNQANRTIAAGMIDELYLYNRLLQDCEIEDLYQKVQLPTLAAAIDAPITTGVYGDTFQFGDISNSPACVREWLVDGTLISNDSAFTFTPTGIGNFEIKLVVTDALCNMDTTLVNITVNPTLDLGSDTLLCINAPLHLMVSNIFDSVQWTINQTIIANGTQLVWTATSYDSIRVAAYFSGNVIRDTIVIDTMTCLEICDNGFDDDYDGLVDCFDDDCCASCPDNYYNTCAVNCDFEVTNPVFNLQTEWTSTNNWLSFSTPIVGDLDGDGTSEIVNKTNTLSPQSAGRSAKNIFVIDGKTGALETTIITPWIRYISDVTIGDIDKNGYGEIYFQASNWSGNPANERRKVFCYEYDISTNQYTQKWMSNAMAGQTSGNDGLVTALADFNQDGIAEVYIGNQIFDGLTGVLLVDGGSTNDYGATSPTTYNAFTVAADVLPDYACADCSGLELIAGSQVYAIHIDTQNIANNRITVAQELMGFGDGNTAIADIDKDGDLDAIIASYNPASIYIWDLQTPTQIYTTFSTGVNNASLSQPNIADFDGDGQLEIGFSIRNVYRVIKWNGSAWTTLWQKSTSDGSGFTGSTVFDFEGDGKSEVIYRDETVLRIFDGATGTDLTSISCASGTGYEYPVVVDVDKDGESEILCGCGTDLKAFKSNGTPWVNARSVWNQHSFFNVNVKDDLTIPIQQQQQHIIGDSLILNNFLNQYSNPNFPVPDATIDLMNVTCNGDSLSVTLSVCNLGERTLSNEMPIAFYNQNPTKDSTTALIWVTNLGQDLNVDSCALLTYLIPNTKDPVIFAVANDDNSLVPIYDLSTDFPVTSIGECDFTNNIDSIISNISAPNDNFLGNDTTICEGGSLVLEAGNWATYLWSDSSTASTLLVDTVGVYWVEVTDTFGCPSRDTILISCINVDIIQNDTTICAGESIILSTNDTVTADIFRMDFNNGFSRYFPTKLGTKYYMKVSGSYSKWSGSSRTLDAGYNSNYGNRIKRSLPASYSGGGLRPVPDVYNPAHVYDFEIIGNGTPIHFTFYDSYYSDNWGYLDIEIYEVRDYSFTWSTGDTTDNITVSPTQTTTYYLEANGCMDSVVVTVIPIDTTLLFEATCDSLLTGIDTTLLSNQFGCDSIVITTTTLLPSSDTTIFLQSCNPIDTGTVVINLVNQFGCDSIVTEITTLLPSSDTTIFLQSCNPTDTGMVIINLANQFGCDSIVTEITTLLPSSDTTIFLQSCNPIDTGMVIINLANQFGCDSIVTEITTLLPSSDTTIFLQSCNPIDTGMVVINLANQFGCDSIVTKITTLLPVSQSTVSLQSCNPIDTGTITTVLTNQFGCDSIVTTITTLQTADSIQTNTTICDGDSVTFQNQVFYNEGLYCILSPDFCTIYCLNLTVIPLPEVELQNIITTTSGKTIALNPNGNPNYFYQWTPVDFLDCSDCPNPTATPTATTTYNATVENIEGCTMTDSITIIIHNQCADDLDLPNAIIPNSANGEFLIGNTEIITSFEYLRIYNRWGQLVFQTTDMYEPWEGTFNGKMVDMGVYTYYLKGKCSGDKDFITSGNVTVIK